MEKLEEGVAQSCCILLVLNDETMSSQWCQHECNFARSLGIPIVCLLDIDRQPARPVIDGYMEAGYGFLFDSQVISYSTQSREHSYSLIAKALEQAVADSCSIPSRTEAIIEKIHENRIHEDAVADASSSSTGSLDEQFKAQGSMPTTPQRQLPDEKAEAAIHGASSSENSNDDASSLDQFKVAVLNKYGLVTKAFAALSKDTDAIQKKAWKKAIKQLLPVLLPAEAKRLRKQLHQLSVTELSSFSAFLGSGVGAEETAAAAAPNSDHLAALPVEVPELPSSFQQRLHPQNKLIAALLSSDLKSSSTSLTAPKSKVSSQGMGGVGKTMLTAAVVRHEQVRAAFEVIVWINMSQEPDLLQLQQLAYSQLTGGDSLPQKSRETTKTQLMQLEKKAKERVVLLVLDDMWDGTHEKAFACIDERTASRVLVTTRIKGLLSNGAEIELELLSIAESVELLAGVAELDAAQIPPQLLQIAQLCGRLPLCLNIVGKLVAIKTYGAGWEEDVAMLLKSDMKSLAQEEEGVTMTMQQRVIQSGLDSIASKSAAEIVRLFKGLAVFAEDQVIPVAVINVLWASISGSELSPIMLRQWVSHLLGRSILLGNLADGVSMHDIVRDFTLASHSPAEFTQLQRAFISSIFDTRATAHRNSKAASTVKTYLLNDLTSHFRAAIMTPIQLDDTLALAAIVHSERDVSFQVLQAVDRSEVAVFAQRFTTEAGQYDYWTAGRILMTIADHCDTATYGKEIALGYLRSAQDALGHVSDSQAGLVGKMIQIHSGIATVSTDPDEQAECFKRTEEIIDDENKLQQLDGFQKVLALNQSGLTHMGVCAGTYSTPTVPLYRAEKGAQRMIQSGLSAHEFLPVSGLEGYMFGLVRSLQFLPLGFMTLTFVSPTKLAAVKSVLIGEGGSLVVEWFASYDLQWHEMAKAQNQDGWHGWGLHSVLLVNQADVIQSESILDKWETIDRHAQESNSAITQSVFYAWPMVGSARLRQVYKRRSLNWANIESIVAAIPQINFQWIQGDLFLCHKRTMHALMKANLALHLPESIAPSELAEFLPPSWCDAFFKDVFFESLGMGASLASLVSRLTFLNGEFAISRRVTTKELASHTNPVRQLHAHMNLASFAKKRD